MHPDLVCLIDTHLLDADINELKKIWQGEIINHGFKSNARGITLLFGKGFEYEIDNVDKTSANILALDIALVNAGIRIRLIIIYAPNRDEPNFFEIIQNKIESSNQDYNIICGDFNIALDPKLDCFNYVSVNNPKARDKLLQLMNMNNLIDVYRQYYPTRRRYTWRRTNPIKQARLDYFIISETMADIIDKCKINSSYRSDHSIIEIDIILSNFVRNRGRWQMNTSLLKDSKYLTIINSAIEDEVNFYSNSNSPSNLDDTINGHYTIDHDILLEMVIMRCRKETISYSRKCKNKEKAIERNLIKLIENLEKSNTDSSKLDQTKRQLEQIREEYIKGSIVRSRTTWLNEFEKPTKFYLNLENRKYVEKTIKRIEKSSGEILLDQKEILQEIKAFYEKLFSNHDNISDIQNFDAVFAGLDIKKLNDKQKISLEEDLSEHELTSTLKQMKNFKTPGICGFPAEFFKVFWKRLKSIIFGTFQHCFNKGILPITLRQSLIICLPKGNKPRQYLKNWRPLSMLSVLYKLLSGALANRLKKTLFSIISETQSGFIEGRFIGDTTRLIYDVMHHTEQKKLSAMLMCIDFEKAFDSISWKFLVKTLQTFNFGKKFIRWIKILNTEITATVIQCGTLSERFAIERGCRQGDPISPYLFLLPVELLCLLIKHNPNIKGIKINGLEIKLVQFADDTSLVLDGSALSLQSALNTLEIFGSISGLKMNTEKTKIVWLGRKKHSREKIETNYNLLWGTTEFCLLGINFHVDLFKMSETNYTDLAQFLRNQINCWNKRNITPLGKICLIKSLFLAKMNHKLSILPNPKASFIKELDNAFYKFVWSNKPDKIKRSTLTQYYKHGGIRMPILSNVIMASKASWLRKLLKNTNHVWIELFEKTICEIKNLMLFGLEYMKHISSKCSNPFWKEVLIAFYNINKDNTPKTYSNILYSPLWFNNSIFEIPLHYPKLSKSGVYFVKDVLHSNGELIKFEDLKKTADVNILDFFRIRYFVNRYLKKYSGLKDDCPAHPSIPFHIELLYRSKKGNRDFLQILTKENAPITAVKNWHNKLETVINQHTWSSIFKLCHFTIDDNYFKWFNYKILHRILGTNSLLFQMNITENPSCRFCNESRETLTHLFVDCRDVQIFWTNLFNWISSKLNILIQKDNITLLFGYLYNTSDRVPINTILIVAKNYIFQSATFKQKLILEVYKKKLLKVYLDQSNLSILRDTEIAFDKKWLKFQPLIEDIA